MSRHKKKKKPAASRPNPGHGTESSGSTPAAAVPLPVGGGPKTVLLGLARVLFTVSLGISLYLAYISLTSGKVAGCGLGGNCDEVLASRWGRWFGLPVSVPASAFYVALLGVSFFAGPGRPIATQRRAWQLLFAGAFMVLGAALWFTGLQATVLHSWCTHCMTAHILGGIGAVLVLAGAPFVIRSGTESPVLFDSRQRLFPAVIGITMLLPLVAGQFLGSGPAPQVVENRELAPTVESAVKPVTAEEQKSRMFSLFNGRFQFDLYQVPLLGRPDAPNVMVSLFDYTCSHCRSMHERLVRVQQQYSNDLAIVLMPMPLDASCNPLLSATGPDHVNACDYARTGMALFKAAPVAFHDYETWFFETPKPRPLQEVRDKAREWAGQVDFDAALASPGIESWIQLGISVFQANAQVSGQRTLPMLMVGSAIQAGELPSDDALINLLVRHLGMTPPATAPNPATPVGQ